MLCNQLHYVCACPYVGCNTLRSFMFKLLMFHADPLKLTTAILGKLCMFSERCTVEKIKK